MEEDGVDGLLIKSLTDGRRSADGDGDGDDDGGEAKDLREALGLGEQAEESDPDEGDLGRF